MNCRGVMNFEKNKLITTTTLYTIKLKTLLYTVVNFLTIFSHLVIKGLLVYASQCFGTYLFYV